MNQATEKGNGIDLRPEWGIFIPSVLVIILISIPAVLYPKAAEEVVSAIYQPFAANFGTLYLWITVGLIILCVYFACSRYGDIKFGDPDEKPEFSLSSWIAMIFCSGVAGAVMFWSIIEPLWDIVQPPQYAAPMSTQAYDWALAYLLLHWGPNAWCTYFITALPIAYMFHIRRKLPAHQLRRRHDHRQTEGRPPRALRGRVLHPRPAVLYRRDHVHLPAYGGGRAGAGVRHHALVRA